MPQEFPRGIYGRYLKWQARRAIHKFSRLAQELWPASDGPTEVSISTLNIGPSHITYDPARRGIGQQVMEIHVKRVIAQRLATDKEQVLEDFAAAFGPRFDSYDVEGPSTNEPNRLSKRGQAIINAVRDELQRPWEKDRGRHEITATLARAAVLSITRSNPPHLARLLAPIATASCQSVNPERHAQALAEIRKIYPARRTTKSRVELAKGPTTKRLARTIELTENPDLIAQHEVVSDSNNQNKIELFEIMRVLSNVVNEDVTRFMATVAPVDDFDSWMTRLTDENGPLRAKNSSLNAPKWANAVARAATLLRATPSEQHEEALEHASDLQAVLNDIEQGYGATRGETALINAATSLIESTPNRLTALEVRKILLQSSALLVTQASGNALQLNAFRNARAIPMDSEGTYEPIPEPRRIDRSNLVFDEKHGRIAWRKQPTSFLIPRSDEFFMERATHDMGNSDESPTIADIVTDPMDATVTLTCPGLTPASHKSSSPLEATWRSIVNDNYDLSIIRRFPSTRMIQLPGQEPFEPEQEIRTIDLSNIRGVRVEIVDNLDPLLIAGDDLAKNFVQFGFDGDTLRLTGTGETPATETMPVLRVGIRKLEHCELTAKDVDFLFTGRLKSTTAEVPDNGTLVTQAKHAHLTVGEDARCIAIPQSYDGIITLRTSYETTSTPARVAVLNKSTFNEAEITRTDKAHIDVISATRRYPFHIDTKVLGTSKIPEGWEIDASALHPHLQTALEDYASWSDDSNLKLPGPEDAARQRSLGLVHELRQDSTRFGYGGRSTSAAKPFALLTTKAQQSSEFFQGLVGAAEDPRLSPTTRSVLGERLAAVITTRELDRLEPQLVGASIETVRTINQRLEQLRQLLPSKPTEPTLADTAELARVATEDFNVPQLLAAECDSKDSARSVLDVYDRTEFGRPLAACLADRGLYDGPPIVSRNRIELDARSLTIDAPVLSLEM